MAGFLGTPGRPRLFTADARRPPARRHAVAGDRAAHYRGRRELPAGRAVDGRLFRSASASAAPVLSRLIDRRGPTVVLVPCASGPARDQHPARPAAGRFTADRAHRRRRAGRPSLPPLAPTSARCGRPWSTTQPRSKRRTPSMPPSKSWSSSSGPLLVVATRALGRYRGRDHRRRRARQRGALVFATSGRHGPGEARPQPKRGRTRRCTRPASGCWSRPCSAWSAGSPRPRSP